MEIKIEKPCAENWAGMTPDATGRFCSVCAKSVHDFTNKPKEELLEFLLCSTQSPCIRMLSSQEQFTLEEVQTTAQRILHSGKAIPAAAMALVMLFATSCEPQESKTDVPITEENRMSLPASMRPHYLQNIEVPEPVIPKMGFTAPIIKGDDVKGEAPTIKFRKPVPIKCGEEKVDDEHPSDMKEEEVTMGAPPQDLSIDYSEHKPDNVIPPTR